MSENRDQVPLSMTVQIPGNKDAKAKQYYRRARSNVRGTRANTLPAPKPGVPVSRIVPDNDTIRRWALGREYPISDRGPIPVEIREDFDTWLKVNGNGAWNVQVISLHPPGAKKAAQYFLVRQGQVEIRTTQDPDMVKRDMGPEVYRLLTVPPRRRKRQT